MKRWMCSRLEFLAPAVLLVLIFTADVSFSQQLIRDGDRVVFLGDSNTYAGQYVADIDAYLKTQSKLDVEILNVGLPSETCCGLSEPDHPFPRPTVQERIDRVLAKMKPDVVVACYGMNDGIYHPFSEGRFAAYQAGVRELIEKVKKTGARLILLTPPPFDALPLKRKKKVVGADAEKFAWFLVYENYDDVLAKYSEWIKSQKDKVDLVIDIRSPVIDFLKKKRKSDPGFTMSGDGVHFNAACHRLIAEAFLKAVLPNSDPLKLDQQTVKLSNQKMKILRDAWLTETGHKRPGVKSGKPIAEAIKAAEKIDAKVAALGF